MKLSVIIPYYNAEKYIFTLLESLQDQGFQKEDYEIIIIDDGSTNSVEDIRSYCARHNHLKYIWQENGRQSKARNNGISVAAGDYLFFCDADDVIRRQSLCRLCSIATEKELDILFFNRVIVTENEPIQSVNNVFTLDEIMTGQKYFGRNPDMSLGVGHFIISKRFVEKNKLSYPEGILSVEDATFMINSLIVSSKVGYINVDVYFWIQHAESISHYEGKIKMAERYNNDRIWFVEKYNKILKSKQLESSFASSLKHQMEIQSFACLHNSLRYLSVKKTKEYIHRLKLIGEYPFGHYLTYSKPYMFINGVMNCYPVWISCCWLFSLLPTFIKRKF